MNTSKHLSDNELVEYLKAPQQARFEQMRLHLATCSDCRGLCELTTQLRQHSHLLNSGGSEEHDDISDLMHGRLSTQQAAELKRCIKQEPATLKAALHYASHHIAMQNQSRAEGTSDRSVSGPALLSRLSGIFKHWMLIETPIWKMAPVAAVFVMVISLFMIQNKDQNLFESGLVVSYQDNPLIQFVAQESQPGIGFFSDVKKHSKPFGNMEIQLKDNHAIQFTWKAVDDAQDYRLKLQVFRNGEMVVIGQVSSSESKALLRLADPLSPNRHEWVLSGNTTDGRAFQTSGGFVIKR